MPWKKGQSGNPKGRAKDQPFKTALDMELKAAGVNQKALRGIARKLIAAAESGEPWAIREIADRLDGKPVIQGAVDHTHSHTVHDASDDELIDIARSGRSNGSGQAESPPEPDIVH